MLFLAYSRTGNLFVAGLVLFIEYGVYTLTFLVAPIVDRVKDKRTILLICYPLQAITAAILAEQLTAGTLSTAVLLAAVLALATLWDFVWVVQMVVPRLVVPPRLLFAADGLSGAIGTGYQVAGYAGGGALVYLVGPEGGVSAYAILLIAALAAAIPLVLTGAQAPKERFREAFARGWEAFRGAAGRVLRQWASIEVVYGFFSAFVPLLITAIAYEEFTDPSAVYGVLVTAEVLGGAVAGVVAGHYNPRRYVGALLVASPLVAGGAILSLLAVPGELAGLGALLALAGAAIGVRYTAKYSWVRGIFAPERLGRAISNIYFFTGAASSIAAVSLGALSTAIGVPAVIALSGVGLAIAGLLALSLPLVRSLKY